MKINISSKNYPMSEKLSSYIEKKLNKIGKYFGGRKHSTVINSISNIDENSELKKEAEEIKKRINES